MIDEERGDIINIVFEKFPIHVAQDEEGEVKVERIEAKLMIVVLIITSIFLIMYILLQSNSLESIRNH